MLIRSDRQLNIAFTALILLMTASPAPADEPAGAFIFTPLTSSADINNWNPSAPWKLPAGFSQTLVSDETALNIYDKGRNDWTDMNTVNETGSKAGRFLYRTHEMRHTPEGAAVSVVDLQTGKTTIVAQGRSWRAVDGIRWTPWGSLLIGEEKQEGRLIEIILDDSLISGKAVDRPAAGRMAHEGIEVDEQGAVYLVDEFRGETEGFGGSIYKFVPKSFGDLSDGRLYVLKVKGKPDGTGQGIWAGPISPTNARKSSRAIGGTSYQRPEDLEIIGDILYAAITDGKKHAGRVLAINLRTLQVSNFIKPGINAPIETNGKGGFAKPDNLAESPDGRLVIIEDNSPSDIWFAEKDNNGDGLADSISLFASLSDPKAEGTGIYFSPGSTTLFVNVQHSAIEDGDGTWAIRKQK